MSDNLRDLVDKMRTDLTSVTTHLHEVTGGLQDARGDPAFVKKVFDERLTGVEGRLEHVGTALSQSAVRFDHFLAWFEEAMEMHRSQP